MASSKIITVIGSLNVDLVTVTSRVPSGGETLTAQFFSTGSGGKGANQAVACSRVSRPNPKSQHLASNGPSSDVTVKMVGAVGDDEFGPKLIDGLKADGIDTSGIKVVSETTTGVAVIIVESASGENRIMLSPGANHTLRPEDFKTRESLGSPLPDLIVLQLEIPLPTVLQILETARAAGVEVLVNPAPAINLPDHAYELISHLIVNESEAAILAGKEVTDLEAAGWDSAMSGFIKKGASNVVVTLGSAGATFMLEKENKGHFIKAAKVTKVVDTTAAGDTFVGAYAVSMVREKGKGVNDAAIKFACTAAARTVEKAGAQSAIPWSDEINRSDSKH